MMPEDREGGIDSDADCIERAVHWEVTVCDLPGLPGFARNGM